MHFKGLYTNLITPFCGNNLDTSSIHRLIALQLEHDIDGLVVFSNLGEELSLSQQEYEQLLQAVIAAVDGKIPIIAGVGISSTTDSINKAIAAKRLGAHGLIISPPIYNNLTEDAIFNHYNSIHSSVDMAIVISDSTNREVQFSDMLIEKLLSLHNVIGFNNANGDLERALWLSNTLLKEEGKSQFVAKDSLSTAFSLYGGANLISSAANVIPDLCVKLHKLISLGQYDEAMKLQALLLHFHLHMDSNKGPALIKYVAYLFDLIDSYETRAPLPMISKEDQRDILQTINQLQDLI